MIDISVNSFLSIYSSIDHVPILGYMEKSNILWCDECKFWFYIKMAKLLFKMLYTLI